MAEVKQKYKDTPRLLFHRFDNGKGGHIKKTVGIGGDVKIAPRPPATESTIVKQATKAEYSQLEDVYKLFFVGNEEEEVVPSKTQIAKLSKNAGILATEEVKKETQTEKK